MRGCRSAETIFRTAQKTGLPFDPVCPITLPTLAKVCSAAVNGIEAYPVEVEVNAGYGDTIIVIVGLPDAAVKKSRDRVMTAPINSGFNFTFGRTTINLAPADVKKEGPSFDLPIAIGMVAASEQTETDQLEDFIELRRGQRPGEREAGDGNCRRRRPQYAAIALNHPVFATHLLSRCYVCAFRLFLARAHRTPS